MPPVDPNTLIQPASTESIIESLQSTSESCGSPCRSKLPPEKAEGKRLRGIDKRMPVSTPKKSRSCLSPSQDSAKDLQTNTNKTPNLLYSNNTLSGHERTLLNPTGKHAASPRSRSCSVGTTEDGELPLSSLGWPDTFDDIPDTSSQNSLDDFPRVRRSLLSELMMSNELDDDDQHCKTLTESEESENHDSQRHTSTANVYDDEVDVFFSSTIDEPLEHQLYSQVLDAEPEPEPTFITSKPHFLTAEYFKNNGPDSRIYEDESDDALEVTSYFDTNYTVLDQLGSGEYSNVWKARKVDSGKVYAIKKTKAPFGSYDDRWQQIIEVDHLRIVKGSRHCVELVDAWEQGGFLFVQMELCTSGSLHEFRNACRGRLVEENLWGILYEIATGLNDIHMANVIHLDLKPSNILIDKAGRLKIGDFGLSVRWPASMKEIKSEGDRRYMAPDLLREHFDKPADIFSLGLLMLELSTDIVLPDTGESWELLRVGDFSDIKQDLARIPLRLRKVLEWMLTPSPKTRPTIEDVLQEKKLVKAKESEIDDHGILFQLVPKLEAFLEQSSQIDHENSYCTPETKSVRSSRLVR